MTYEERKAARTRNRTASPRAGAAPATITDEQRADLDVLRAMSWSDFASSLAAQFDKRGSLSDKQWPWVAKLAAEQRARDAKRAETAKVTPAGLPAIVNLFDVARANGRKYPRITFERDGLTVVLKRAGGGARVPHSINITDGGSFGDNVWYGRIHTDGRLESSRQMTPAIAKLLQALNDDPAKAAAEYGRATSQCCFCATEITTDASLAVGYGPVCASKYGLPWG